LLLLFFLFTDESIDVRGGRAAKLDNFFFFKRAIEIKENLLQKCQTFQTASIN